MTRQCCCALRLRPSSAVQRGPPSWKAPHRRVAGVPSALCPFGRQHNDMHAALTRSSRFLVNSGHFQPLSTVRRTLDIRFTLFHRQKDMGGGHTQGGIQPDAHSTSPLGSSFSDTLTALPCCCHSPPHRCLSRILLSLPEFSSRRGRWWFPLRRARQVRLWALRMYSAPRTLTYLWSQARTAWSRASSCMSSSSSMVCPPAS